MHITSSADRPTLWTSLRFGAERSGLIIQTRLQRWPLVLGVDVTLARREWLIPVGARWILPGIRTSDIVASHGCRRGSAAHTFKRDGEPACAR